jgi:mercuric ion transport protein
MRIADKAAAGLATISGFGGLFAAAACCVLPLALAGVGIGAAGLARLAPLHAPLSAIALIAVVAGWFLHLRRKRACAARADCAPPSNVTLPLLVAATIFVALSGTWPFLEPDLMRAFGG